MFMLRYILVNKALPLAYTPEHHHRLRPDDHVYLLARSGGAAQARNPSVV